MCICTLEIVARGSLHYSNRAKVTVLIYERKLYPGVVFV